MKVPKFPLPPPSSPPPFPYPSIPFFTTPFPRGLPICVPVSPSFIPTSCLTADARSVVVECKCRLEYAREFFIESDDEAAKAELLVEQEQPMLTEGRGALPGEQLGVQSGEDDVEELSEGELESDAEVKKASETGVSSAKEPVDEELFNAGSDGAQLAGSSARTPESALASSTPITLPGSSSGRHAEEEDSNIVKITRCMHLMSFIGNDLGILWCLLWKLLDL